MTARDEEVTLDDILYRYWKDYGVDIFEDDVFEDEEKTETEKIELLGDFDMIVSNVRDFRYTPEMGGTLLINIDK